MPFLKEIVKFSFVLVCILASYYANSTFDSDSRFNAPADSFQTGNNKQQCIVAVDRNVGSAENSTEYNNLLSNKSVEETNHRKKQRLHFIVISNNKFLISKTYTINKSLCTKRKRHSTSVINENFQLRL